ncbi:hypothetical protein LWE61_04155 [Sphingobium sufflavum]|uniref:hypothetical protein n=1 Tax=Sphingobium sufflavum TaxID=1129547 RepID=UPI001F22A4CF|nr:hypothetical protein [Sphingobium sufflavum]MCE7795748.1 hypothetical protein [Sphingobium sufflavum]
MGGRTSFRGTMLATIVTVACSIMGFALISDPPGLVSNPVNLLTRPLLGLLFGPLLAPATTLASLVVANAMIHGLEVLARRWPQANDRRMWALAGAVGGAIMAGLLIMELIVFRRGGQMNMPAAALLWMTCSGAAVGAVSLLLGRRFL